MATQDPDQIEPMLAGRRALRTHGTARTCALPGCSTRLSVYNGNDRCWPHIRSATSEPANRPDRSQTNH